MDISGEELLQIIDRLIIAIRRAAQEHGVDEEGGVAE